MIFSRDVIFRELRTYIGEGRQKENIKIVHFETKIKKQEDTHVEEQLDGLEDREKEEGSKSSDDVQDENIKEEEEQEESITPILRRSTRQQHSIDRYNPLDFYCKFSLLSTDYGPRSFMEALSSFEESEFWMQNMQEKMMDLDSFDTWDLVSFPKVRNPISCKWVFKKFGVDRWLE